MGKKDFTECPSINDLMLGKGQVTPPTLFSLSKRGFSTDSLGDATNMNEHMRDRENNPQQAAVTGLPDAEEEFG